MREKVGKFQTKAVLEGLQSFQEYLIAKKRKNGNTKNFSKEKIFLGGKSKPW